MAKTKKVVKRILITLLTVTVLIAVGGYCVFNFYIKPKYSDKIMEAVNVILEDEELMADISEVLADEELQAEISEVLSDSEMQAELDSALEDIDLEGLEIPTEEQTATAAPENTVKPTSPANTAAPAQSTATSQTAAPTEAPKKSQTLMEKAKANVEPKDFADGLKLAGKIDVGYILGLMSGGLTEEEKAEAKAYFKTKYTKAERNRIKGYMAKYAHLLE